MGRERTAAGYVWRGNGFSEFIYIYSGNGGNDCIRCFRSNGRSTERNGYFRDLCSGRGDSVGGGATRDIILGIVPPGMFQNPIYTIVATVTSCIVFAIMYWKQELLEGENRLVYDKIMLVMDSVGLGVFTVMGVDKGITEGYMGRTFFLVFLGTVTGVGGGLIRDMMAGVPPYILCAISMPALPL